MDTKEAALKPITSRTFSLAQKLNSDTFELEKADADEIDSLVYDLHRYLQPKREAHEQLDENVLQAERLLISANRDITQAWKAETQLVAETKKKLLAAADHLRTALL